jgi:hypothetical protein
MQNLSSELVGQPSVDSDILLDLPWNLNPNSNLDAAFIGMTSFDRPSVNQSLSDSHLYFTEALRRYGVRGSERATLLSRYTQSVDMVLDACIRCQAASLAHKFSKQMASVYFFVYDYPHGKAVHRSLVRAVFGDSSLDQGLIQKVQSAWTTFVKTGTPDLHKAWPKVLARGLIEAEFLRKDSFIAEGVEVETCQNWISTLNRLGAVNVSRMCSGLESASHSKLPDHRANLVTLA